MKTRNILYKGLFSVAILAIAVAPAIAEGTFSHPPVDSDPHGKIEGDSPHRKSSEGMMGGHGRSSGRGFSSGHSKSGSFSEKGIKAKLHLDDEQSMKMHRLFMEYRKGTILKTATLRIAQIELDEAVGGGDFDMAEIESKAKQKESAATELTMVRVHALAKSKTFLSDDQFKRFIKMVAHRMGRGGRYSKSGGHHGGKQSSKHHSSKSKSKHHGSGSPQEGVHGGFGSGGFGGSEGY